MWNAYYLLDEDYNPVPVTMQQFAEYAAKYENPCKHVAFTYIGDVLISTIFIPYNHNFDLQNPEPPLVFETRISGGSYDDWQMRFSTWDEAVQGHSAVVQLVKLSMSGQIDPS